MFESYLVGLIESDGYIYGGSGNDKRVTIEIFLTDIEPIEYVKEEWNLNSYYTINRTNKKEGYRIRIRGIKAKRFLSNYYQYFSKRRQEQIDKVFNRYESQPVEFHTNAWAGGLIDGDGCVDKKGYIQLCSQDIDTAKKFAELTQGNLYQYKLNQVWIAKKVLRDKFREEIAPYMKITRKKQRL